MVGRQRRRASTAFTVSIEARDGVTTGISAADRAHTIKVAVDRRAVRAGPRPAGPRLPAARPRRRRARARRARPRQRSTSPGSPASPARRRHLRDHERRRHDGARAGPPRFAQRARPARSSRSPTSSSTGARKSSSSTASPRSTLPTDYGEFRPSATRRRSTTSTTSRSSRATSRTSTRTAARARPLRVPHRRRLRTRCAATAASSSTRRCEQDRGRRQRRPALPRPGGPRHRPRSTSSRPTHLQEQGLDTVEANVELGFSPTCASTASARRSSPTSASRRSA